MTEKQTQPSARDTSGARLFALVQSDQGKAFISDAIETLPKREVLKLAKQTLDIQQKLNKKLAAWIKKEETR